MNETDAFCLDQAHVVVLRVHEAVLVEGMVLRCHGKCQCSARMQSMGPKEV